MKKIKIKNNNKKIKLNQNEGLKLLYKGVEKLLNKNSIEYKEIVEKNKEAWKRLANL
jgi:hypothetical protein